MNVKEKLKKINKKQLARGKVVEKEHGAKKPGTKETDVTHGDKEKTKKIAQVHLLEDPKYYTHLDEMEKKYAKKAKQNTVKKKGK